MRHLLIASLLFGCSGKVLEEQPASDTGTDVATDVATDVVEDTPTDADPAACAREADTIAAKITGIACTTTVRISQIDFSILGWNAYCGMPGTLLDDKAARAALASYPEYVKIEDFTLLQKGDLDRPWIFWHGAGDFGGVGAVDPRTGMPVYYATLSWSAMGTVKLPKENPPAPFVCTPDARPAYHVVSMADARPDTDGAAIDALARTPILRGIQRVHGVAGITLLHVPLDLSVGPSGAKPKNEWVAMIASVLLE